jgi:hypothetical protein
MISCPSSACTTRWKPWASSTSCTPRCSAIHAEKQQLAKDDAIADWVAKQGWTRPSSSSSTTPSRWPPRPASATQLQNAYRVEGVPAMGVAGRFYTDGTMAKHMPTGTAGRRLPGRAKPRKAADRSAPAGLAVPPDASKNARCCGPIFFGTRVAPAHGGYNESRVFKIRASMKNTTRPLLLAVACALSGARPWLKRPTATSP